MTNEAIAKAICGRGKCFCGYDCGHTNKSEHPLPIIGHGTVCPLAKYNVQPDTRDPFSIPWSENPTEEDCWAFCATCEQAEVDAASGQITLKGFYTHCMDCPVQAAREAIQEASAEC